METDPNEPQLVHVEEEQSRRLSRPTWKTGAGAHPWIGRRGLRVFPNGIAAVGTISGWLSPREGAGPTGNFSLWRMVHEDGDEEDLEQHEVEAASAALAVAAAALGSPAAVQTAKRTWRVGGMAPGGLRRRRWSQPKDSEPASDAAPTAGPDHPAAKPAADAGSATETGDETPIEPAGQQSPLTKPKQAVEEPASIAAVDGKDPKTDGLADDWQTQMRQRFMSEEEAQETDGGHAAWRAFKVQKLAPSTDHDANKHGGEGGKDEQRPPRKVAAPSHAGHFVHPSRRQPADEQLPQSVHHQQQPPQPPRLHQRQHQQQQQYRSVCRVCTKTKDKDEFSATQWKRKEGGFRCCKACVAMNDPSQQQQQKPQQQTQPQQPQQQQQAQQLRTGLAGLMLARASRRNDTAVREELSTLWPNPKVVAVKAAAVTPSPGRTGSSGSYADYTNYGAPSAPPVAARAGKETEVIVIDDPSPSEVASPPPSNGVAASNSISDARPGRASTVTTSVTAGTATATGTGTGTGTGKGTGTGTAGGEADAAAAYAKCLQELRMAVREEERQCKARTGQLRQRQREELHAKRQDFAAGLQSAFAKFDGQQHAEKQRHEQQWEQETGMLVRAVNEARAIPIAQFQNYGPPWRTEADARRGQQQAMLLQQLDATMAGLRQQLTTALQRRQDATAAFTRAQIVARTAHREGVEADLAAKVAAIEADQTQALEQAETADKVHALPHYRCWSARAH
jgi:hypothetical protein